MLVKKYLKIPKESNKMRQINWMVTFAFVINKLIIFLIN